MSLDTNLNVSPYFDDYNQDKNYHRILFRPATAVQTRELTQLQTILQNQVERFGSHIFEDGSVIEGCDLSYLNDLELIRSEDDTIAGNSGSYTPESFDGAVLVGANSGVQAKVVIGKNGFREQYPDTHRFYITYERSGDNDKRFQSGETIQVYNPTDGSGEDRATVNAAAETANSTFTALVPTSNTESHVDLGYGLTVSDGIIFQKGFFVRVDEQTILVSDHTSDPAGKLVGFDTEETLVDQNEDPSLLDNSSGSTNENAPGAHRLKLTPKLVVRDEDDVSSDESFFAITRFSSEGAVQENIDPEYARLGESIAQRTYEESGDYTVSSFNVEAFSSNTEANTIYYQISPGVAYVRGQRVELMKPIRIKGDRGIDRGSIERQDITFAYGNYLTVEEVKGDFGAAVGKTVDLYSSVQQAVTNDRITGSSGVKIGEAKVHAVRHLSGAPGSPDARYNIYVYDIRMSSQPFSDVRGVFLNDGGVISYADIVGSPELKESSGAVRIFNVGKVALDSMSNMQYEYFGETSGGSVGTSGTTSVGIGTEFFAQGANLSSFQKAQCHVIPTAMIYTTDLQGTISTDGSGTTVTGSNTTFTDDYVEGDYIRENTGGNTAVIINVLSDTELTLGKNLGANLSGEVHQRAHPEGSIVNFANSVNRTIFSTSSSTTVDLDFGSTMSTGSTSFIFQYPGSWESSVVPIDKTINKNRFVKIDTANNAAGDSGPWNLGLVDVHQIRGIYLGNNGSYANTDSKDYSYAFTLDNGQRDTHYDFAKISVKPNQQALINSTSTILVELDYFDASDSQGFFNVDSYPITTAATANSTTITYAEIPIYESLETYDLRGAIDFRSRKTNSANDATTTAGATINPVPNHDIDAPSNLRFAYPAGNFEGDIDYFLSRKDTITITPDGDFEIKRGVPSDTPKKPRNTVEGMDLALIDIPPFPSLTAQQNEKFDRSELTTRIDILTNKNYTMEDISVLEKRIERLEYYVTLNMLEKDAADLLVLNDSGENRFKNGFFVDTFKDDSRAKVEDPEYRVAIDANKGVLRPFIEKEKFDLDYRDGFSNNVIRKGSFVMLNYTDEKYIEQDKASKEKTITPPGQTKWVGELELAPSNFNGADDRYLPYIPIVDERMRRANPIGGSIYGDWRLRQQVGLPEDFHTQPKNKRGSLEGSVSPIATRNAIKYKLRDYEERSVGHAFKKGNKLLKYTKPTEIAFYAYDLKPNTKVHIYIDDNDFDKQTAPGELNSNYSEFDDTTNKCVSRSGPFGGTLKTNEDGELYGKIKLPEAAIREGKHVVKVIDIDSNETDKEPTVTCTAVLMIDDIPGSGGGKHDPDDPGDDIPDNPKPTIPKGPGDDTVIIDKPTIPRGTRPDSRSINGGSSARTVVTQSGEVGGDNKPSGGSANTAEIIDRNKIPSYNRTPAKLKFKINP